MSPDNDKVSRVHLLLVRIGTEVWAIHTASTNGLFRGDVPVEAEVLGDSDVLRIAGDIVLRWKHTEHPEA
jgi:pSer/pThr/pTyr-binding forkhead associated (FHA) protein